MNTFPRYYHVQQAYDYLKKVNPHPHPHLKVSALIRRMEILSDKGATMPYSCGVPKKARHRRKYLRYARQALKICGIILYETPLPPSAN